MGYILNSVGALVRDLFSDDENGASNGKQTTAKPKPVAVLPKNKTVSPMDVAKRYLGMHERSHTDTLASFFRKAGGQRLNPADTAWCAAFVNAVLGECGFQGTGSLMARSFARWGYGVSPLSDAQPGDIVVFWRGSPMSGLGHVAFFVKWTGDYVHVLGGNQGDKVSIMSYPKSRIVAIRRPPGIIMNHKEFDNHAEPINSVVTRPRNIDESMS